MKSFFITILTVLLLSGCTTTQTTSQIISDDTIKAMITAVDKLDKEQVKKLETAIKEKLKDEKNGKISNGEFNDGEVSNNGNNSGNTNDTEKSKFSNLKWSEKGDECHIVQCYFGDGHDSELFKLASQLPVDFACTLDNSGVHITKPASDDTAWMTSYPGDHMQARRAFVCVFNESNELVSCQDWAESDYLDNRWKNEGAVKGFVIHCKQGKAVSRTDLTEVK